MGPRRPRGSSGGMNLESKHRRATARPTGTQQYHLHGKRPAGGWQPLAWPGPGSPASTLPAPTGGKGCGSSTARSLPARVQSTARIPGEQPLGRLQESLLLRFMPAGPEPPSNSCPNAGPWLPTRRALNPNLKLLGNLHFNKAPGDFYPLKLKHNCSCDPLQPYSESGSELPSPALSRES